MRFNVKRSTDILDWHCWFAWYPVRLEDGQVAWLEFVERSKFGMSSWAYRAA